MAELLEESWTKVREGIEVKRVVSPDGSEGTFILCRSSDRRKKEAAIHDRRTNLAGHEESELWTMYMQLNDAEAAFRTLTQDLSIRPCTTRARTA